MTAENNSQNQTLSRPDPFCVLIVLDGLGVRPEEYGNAVLAAETPTLDAVWTQCQSTLIKAAGKEVGLSQGDPGNSEVGHLNIGAGQIVYQSLPRINESIRTGKFADLDGIKKAVKSVKDRGSDLHLMGILSAAGVHGHIEHLFELMKIAKKNGINPYIHVILDGRDTGLKDGYLYLNLLKAKIQELGVGRIASMSGRRYSMDRDHRWERTEVGYYCMVGKGKQEAHDPMEALQEGYKKGENDQIFTPTTIVDESGKPVGPVQDDDVVIFYNYREDRARQITKAFVLDDFDPFERDPRPKNLYFLTMTGYEEGLPVEVLFEPHIIKSTLSSIISDAGYTQLHMSETEKYAHISYFFNGGVEKPHEGELFFNIPSPKVFDYSDTPAMSAEVIRDEAVNRIESGKYNFVMMNFANPDMLGHTGDFDATVESIQIMDKCVRDVIDAIQKLGGDFIITADHGNCEEMIDESTNEVNTSHSINPVPLIICNEGKKIEYDRDDAIKIGTGEDSVERGILADVAPTILGLMGLEPTEDMTGIDILPVLKD